MPKRFNLQLTIVLIAIVVTSCYAENKMASRGEYHGPATLTPFLPKATFTAEATPDGQAGDLGEKSPDLTVTMQVEDTGEVDQKTVSPTPTITESTSTAAFTPTSTATLNPGEPTYTLSPPTETTPSTSTAVPTNTSAPSFSPIPTDTTVPSNTPVSGNTSVPSNTPWPPDTAVPSDTPVPTNTYPPAGCSPSGNNSYENQVVTLINQERTSRSLSPLSQNSSLRLAARGHSEDMACNDFFSHTGSNGSSMSSRILAAGYGYSWAAENIAASSSCSFSASAVVNMWMNSAGHKANILSSNAVDIGVGFRCVNDGKAGDLDAYYTANFGKQ